MRCGWPNSHASQTEGGARPPSYHLAAQQLLFNRFRRRYNDERPHDALGGRTPGELYTSSPRSFPERLPLIEYPSHFEKRKVCGNGCLKWHDQFAAVSRALTGDYVGLEEIADGAWSAYYGPVPLARFDEREGRLRP